VRVGVRFNAALGPVPDGVRAAGDTVIDADAGGDVAVAFGWPMAKTLRAQFPNRPVFCVDKGLVRPERRIFALNGWGAAATYHEPRPVELSIRPRNTPGGPILVLGQVDEEHALGSDQWDSGAGYREWLARELAQPNRKFREHPRVAQHRATHERYPTLAEDLAGCACAVGWNSSAAVEAITLGWPAFQFSPTAYLTRFDVHALAGLEWTIAEIRAGDAWRVLRRLIVER
jgi:hypothetical protein